MIQGTTPTLQFNLPIPSTEIKLCEVMVQYLDEQKEITIVKTMDECEIGENTITARLTQEETLALPAPSFVYVQLRILTHDRTALATEVQKVSVKRLLKKDVI